MRLRTQGLFPQIRRTHEAAERRRSDANRVGPDQPIIHIVTACSYDVVTTAMNLNIVEWQPSKLLVSGRAKSAFLINEGEIKRYGYLNF